MNACVRVCICDYAYVEGGQESRQDGVCAWMYVCVHAHASVCMRGHASSTLRAQFACIALTLTDAVQSTHSNSVCVMQPFPTLCLQFTLATANSSRLTLLPLSQQPLPPLAATAPASTSTSTIPSAQLLNSTQQLSSAAAALLAQWPGHVLGAALVTGPGAHDSETACTAG